MAPHPADGSQRLIPSLHGFYPAGVNASGEDWEAAIFSHRLTDHDFGQIDFWGGILRAQRTQALQKNLRNG